MDERDPERLPTGVTAIGALASSGDRTFKVYVRMVTLAGAVVVGGLALLAGPSQLVGSYPRLYWTFLLLFTVTEARPLAWLRRDEGGEVTASWAFAFALLFVAPPAGALLGITSACLVGDALHRKPLVRALFNAANYSLSLGAGAAVLELTGERTTLTTQDPGIRWFLVFIATAVVVIVLNSVLTSAVLAMAQNLPTRQLIREGVSLNLATDAMLLGLAPVFVVVAQRALALVPLLVLTTWAVYRSVELALSRQHEATHDAVTGLPNRRQFVEQVASACLAAESRRMSVAVVMVGLSYLRSVNDHLGEHVGDRCLQDVGERLRAAKRSADLVARIGGDEFAVLLTGLEADEEPGVLVDRMLQVLHEPCVVGGVPVAVGARLGVAVYPQHGDDAETLLRNADQAVYESKGGLSHVVTYEPSKDQWRRNRWDLLAELPGAITDEQLVLHYQPKVAIATGRIVGCEALVRWDHPRLGLIPPVEFMPFAENTELIKPLTEHILRMALQQCARWRADGLDLEISVNASTRNLHDLHFPDLVAEQLCRAGVPPASLELEITENTVMADPVRATTVLAALREQGIRIAVDDFGTGYSSLSHLRELIIDAVKIDRSFITDMVSNGKDCAVVQAIIELARNLDLETVAEGIETVAAWDELRSLGCGHGQGYLITHPLPAAEMTAWVRGLSDGVWNPVDPHELS